jgi:hypothetical protein
MRNRKWAWSHRLPVGGEIFGPPRSSSSKNFRFLAVRQVGRKRDEKFRNPPRNVHIGKKEKAESLAFLELLYTYRMRSRGGASRRGLIKKK